MGIGILGWIVIGLLAGWIASMVMNRHHGLIVNLIIGLIGAVLGGWLAGFFGFIALGCGFRADRARRSDLMPPTIPI
jgi:uncharacterized membrane protein YeaQ/YmgE (transglycosylase-associated protein family)